MDELEQFCAWFLKTMPVIGAVPFHGAVSHIQDVTSILLYRRDQFQVQMFAVPSGTVIPEHTHPNVDSIEVYVGGNIRFSHSGKYVSPAGDVFANNGPLGLASRRGMTVRVRRGVPVSAALAERGCTALCGGRLQRHYDGRGSAGQSGMR